MLIQALKSSEVRCVASKLDRVIARDLRQMLVVEAPGEVFRIDETTVSSPACWLNNDAEEMSFAEWVEHGGSRGILG